jgi:hypothetical protein
MSKKIGGGKLIYHGAEPYSSIDITKEETGVIFSLPAQLRIALALGFRTATKGWSIFERMCIPQEWSLVINSSRNYYCKATTTVELKEVILLTCKEAFSLRAFPSIACSRCSYSSIYCWFIFSCDV